MINRLQKVTGSDMWSIAFKKSLTAEIFLLRVANPLSLASNRAQTRTRTIAGVNYAISAHNPPQTRESVRFIDSQDSTTNVCVLSADSPGNGFNGGVVQNAKECADRSQTAHTFRITPGKLKSWTRTIRMPFI